MKKYQAVFLNCALLCCMIAITTEAISNKNIPNRILRVDEVLAIIVEFENILNKKIPTIADFSTLYFPDDATERESNADADYCEDVLKLEFDTDPCSAAIKRDFKGASLFLLNIKKIITDSKNIPFKFYVDPSLKPCPASDLERHEDLEINGIVIIGNNKYKYITFILPCDYLSSKNDWRIDVISVDNKLMRYYPLTLKKPADSK